ncbi:MAG: hypothetical protein HC925_00070 [Coleofasciculaceae cyanobacterium SM2_3_26]|nr:hypothetical protein [Coleofasciculaceae cyanobacterium SM2_3_26]
MGIFEGVSVPVTGLGRSRVSKPTTSESCRVSVPLPGLGRSRGING